MFVRGGKVIPHVRLAQSTMQMDWSNLDLVIYATDAQQAQGLICLPSDNKLHRISLTRKDNTFVLGSDPLAGKVVWKIQSYSEYGL